MDLSVVLFFPEAVVFPLGIFDPQTFPGFEKGGEFEIDEAEAPGFLIVGDVAIGLILVTHAVFLERVEEGLAFLRAESLVPRTSVAGHQVEFLGLLLEDARNEVAALLFEVMKDPAFVLEPLPGERATIPFVNPPIISHVDFRDGGVLDVSFLVLIRWLQGRVSQSTFGMKLLKSRWRDTVLRVSGRAGRMNDGPAIVGSVAAPYTEEERRRIGVGVRVGEFEGRSSERP